MLRGFLVIAAYLCLTGGFVAAVVDGARSIAAGALSLTYAEDVLRPRLPGLQGALDKVSPWLWDPLAVQIMRAPLGLLVGMSGLLLLLMVRRRAGYERFAGFEYACVSTKRGWRAYIGARSGEPHVRFHEAQDLAGPE